MKGTQRRTIRKEKNNSAGFTLIEMIVTVAIIAIFSGVVVTLITTGSSLFRGVSGNTKSQVKAQETLDEIEDLIIDANRSIYYAYGSGTDMGTQITSDIDDSNAASKTFIACNEYENGDGTSRYVFDVLDWVGSEGKLYYSQREYTKASSNTEEENENGTGDNSENQQTVDTSGISAESMDNGVAVFASADNDSGNGVVSGGSSDKAKDSKELIARSVFAEGIENFTVDVTKVESERIVRFRLTTEENGKKVKTLHTVNLRNRIQVMKPDDASVSKAREMIASVLGGEGTVADTTQKPEKTEVFTPTTDPNAAVSEVPAESVPEEVPADSLPEETVPADQPAEQPADTQPQEPEVPAEGETGSGDTAGEAPSISLPTQEEVEQAASSIYNAASSIWDAIQDAASQQNEAA